MVGLAFAGLAAVPILAVPQARAQVPPTFPNGIGGYTVEVLEGPVSSVGFNGDRTDLGDATNWINIEHGRPEQELIRTYVLRFTPHSGRAFTTVSLGVSGQGYAGTGAWQAGLMRYEIRSLSAEAVAAGTMLAWRGPVPWWSDGSHVQNPLWFYYSEFNFASLPGIPVPGTGFVLTLTTRLYARAAPDSFSWVMVGGQTLFPAMHAHVPTVEAPQNRPPIADAGPDQTVRAGTPVTLDGTASHDPDGDVLEYQWEQVAGPAVTLDDGGSPTPGFVAPAGATETTLEFELVVTDGLGGWAADRVVVRVLADATPPSCVGARPTRSILWPPNHKLVPVGIDGIAPAGTDVALTITRVTQDEPVNGLGDGDTSPDAVILDGAVLLRAERSGTGNGRVYRIDFTATTAGGECRGSVTVGVPHDMKRSRPIVDDGQRYDSTIP